METQNIQTSEVEIDRKRITHLEGVLKEHSKTRWPTISINKTCSIYEELAELYGQSDKNEDLVKSARFYEALALETAPFRWMQKISCADKFRNKKTLCAKSAELYARTGNFKKASKLYRRAS